MRTFWEPLEFLLDQTFGFYEASLTTRSLTSWKAPTMELSWIFSSVPDASLCLKEKTTQHVSNVQSEDNGAVLTPRRLASPADSCGSQEGNPLQRPETLMILKQILEVKRRIKILVIVIWVFSFRDYLCERADAARWGCHAEPDLSESSAGGFLVKKVKDSQKQDVVLWTYFFSQSDIFKSFMGR